MLAVRRAEAVEAPKPGGLVTGVVGGVRRLEVRGRTLIVDPAQVLAEECHAHSSASVRVRRPEEAEVVVRLVMRVRLLEALEEGDDIRGARADQPAQQRLDL